MSGTFCIGRYFGRTNKLVSFHLGWFLKPVGVSIKLYYMCQCKTYEPREDAVKLSLQWIREYQMIWSAVLKYFDISSYPQAENRQEEIVWGLWIKFVSWLLYDVDICSYTYKWMWGGKKSVSPNSRYLFQEYIYSLIRGLQYTPLEGDLSSAKSELLFLFPPSLWKCYFYILCDFWNSETRC